MASKYVRDTKAGQAISAYVILKNGKDIARVLACESASGTVLVNVFNYHDENRDAEEHGFQHSRASGYGYDKFTSALSDLTIDGVKMYDHAVRASEAYPADAG